MSHKHYFEALDRSICDILAVHDLRNASLPFGGKPMLPHAPSDFFSLLKKKQNAPPKAI